MNSTSRFTLMAFAALMIVMLSAVMTVPVLADDGAPPLADTPVEVGTSPDTNSETESEAEPASINTENEGEVEPAFAADPATLPELLEQIPENTEVIVTDASGDAIPLTTEEAAQTVVNGDPRWCPTGAVPGAATCSPSFLYFTVADDGVSAGGLLKWMADNPAMVGKAGVIWIASTYDSDVSTKETGPIYINAATDGAALTENFALTIQGGWSGGNNTTVNLNTPSTIRVPLVISGWVGAVTIKNVNFEVTTNTAHQYALSVEADGTITLDGVSVTNSDNSSDNMGGAVLDNDKDGAASLGNIVVNNSVFNNNQSDGLVINTDGTVTTNNLIANENSGAGVRISSTGAAADKSVTMKGYKQFNGNGSEGLYIAARGAIIISNITANENGTEGVFDGVFIDNTASVGAAVTISGINQFTGNTQNGLTVLSHGIVTLSNISALYNGKDGANVDNSNVSVIKNVVINGVNEFSWNIANGLNVLSKGVITTYNITAANNEEGNGALLNNQPNTLGTAGVSVLGTNNFLYNGNALDDDAGLKILSYGAIIANNVTSSFNSGSGAYLDNCSSVARTTSCDYPLVKNVSLTGVNTFNTNRVGLEVYTFGTITLNSITANDNTIGQGVILHNDTEAVVPVTLLIKESAGAININTYGIFNFNKTDGLKAWSHGVVTMNNLTANANGKDTEGDGVYINARKTVGGATVNIKGTNTFNNNQGTGLSIITDGAITTNNLTANYNGMDGDGQGAYLRNNIASTALGVTITGYARVEGNPEEGLYIESRGAVTLNNVIATNNAAVWNQCELPCESGYTYNNYDGVYINNTEIKNDAGDIIGNTFAVAQKVAINGVNSFIHNGLNGLYVVSYGVITLNNVTANNNREAGVYLFNAALPDGVTVSSTVLKGVSVTGYARLNNNLREGLYINTRGAVTLANLYANYNGIGSTSDGVYIKNNYPNYTGAVSAQAVNITGANTFSKNGKNGLYVLSYGAIAVSNITATYNAHNGASLSNCPTAGGDCGLATTAKNLTISGRSLFYRNNYNGLLYSASGIVNLVGITANHNGVGNDYKGINGASSGTGAVTLTCVHVFGNGNSSNDGYLLQTTGALVTFNGSYFGLNTMGAVVGSTPVYKINLACP